MELTTDEFNDVVVLAGNTILLRTAMPHYKSTQLRHESEVIATRLLLSMAGKGAQRELEQQAEQGG